MEPLYQSPAPSPDELPLSPTDSLRIFTEALVNILVMQLELGVSGRYRVVPKVVLRAQGFDTYFYTKDFILERKQKQASAHPLGPRCAFFPSSDRRVSLPSSQGPELTPHLNLPSQELELTLSPNPHLIPLSTSQKKQFGKGRLPGCIGPWCALKRAPKDGDVRAQLPPVCRINIHDRACDYALARDQRWSKFITKTDPSKLVFGPA